MFLVVQLVYVCGILGKQVVYACTLPIQHGAYAIQKFVFWEEIHQKGLANVWMSRPTSNMTSIGILSYNTQSGWLESLARISYNVFGSWVFENWAKI